MIKPSQNNLEQIAREVRKDIINMIYKAQTGHPGGSLSAVEILVALYFSIMEDADRFFLSNGHVCPALYAVMAEKGLIDKKLLDTYSQLGSVLQGHPEKTRLKGIMNTSGPLGLGLAQASGYAVWNRDCYTYCMTSDGEHDEGNHWEAVNFASKYNLNNLIQIVDRNKIMIEGTVEEIMPLGNLKERYESCNWTVFEIDGHNFDEILNAISKAKEPEINSGRPTVVIVNTLFGKGVSYMENDPNWHAKAPNSEEYLKAMEELE